MDVEEIVFAARPGLLLWYLYNVPYFYSGKKHTILCTNTRAADFCEIVILLLQQKCICP